MTNATMAEALESLDLVDRINYEMAPIPILVPAPTVTTRLTARRSLSRKTEVVVSNPVPAILRRSQRTATQKALDQEPKDDITEVKERAASKMPQAKLTYETCEDDDLDEDEEWALNDDDSAEEIVSTDESDEVAGETHEENDTVFTSGLLQEFDGEVDTGPDQAAVNELLEDLQVISLNMLRATYNELKDKQII
ncbi:uncharacterized protein [Miscanthus floridulus]|uniref:uncharacterized protein n=1 Tax=Miscanthus floridulus TaxID=154761 RepID=UPI003458C03E